jgi:hypothetical protein
MWETMLLSSKFWSIEIPQSIAAFPTSREKRARYGAHPLVGGEEKSQNRLLNAVLTQTLKGVPVVEV